MYKTFAVILNWNNAEDTLKCVESLRDAKKVPDEIIVVDNGSNDDSVLVLKQHLDSVVRIIETGENLGYAGGMRVGADYCLANGADLIWFLNNDTIILPDTLNALLDSVERNGLWCMYSPKILYLSDSNRIYFAGRFLEPMTGQLLMASQFSSKSLAPVHKYSATKSDLISDVIQGASFLVPTKIIRKLGFMDEDYFLYYEEYDYSLRLTQYDVRCICVLSAVMKHRREGTKHSSSIALDHIRTYYRLRNRILFWRRRCVPSQARHFIWHLIRQEIKWLVRQRGWKNPTAWIHIIALWHGLKGKSGRVYYPS